jgi:RNA polymerase sigma factor (sigma-70 family)
MSGASGDLQGIYRSHREALKRFIARRTRSLEEAEDILHDIFCALASVDPVERPVERVAAWLYTAARHRIIDRHRKHREERLPAREVEGEWCEEIGGVLAADPGDDPLAAFLNTLAREELQRALDELPEAQRAIFTLTEIEGFSFKEVAASTGIPVNTLLARKHQAVLHLRARLDALYREMIEP